MSVANEVREDVRSCRRCGLCVGGSGPIPFTGPVPSEMAILGEAPGRQEDEHGIPFYGPAGKLLWEKLAKFGVGRHDVFVCNTVSCWPNRTPNDEEIDACRVNLELQLRVADPRFVLVLGRVALQAFLPDARIGAMRGVWFYGRDLLPDARCIATYHPAAVLRNRTYTRSFVDDLKEFVERTRLRS